MDSTPASAIKLIHCFTDSKAPPLRMTSRSRGQDPTSPFVKVDKRNNSAPWNPSRDLFSVNPPLAGTYRDLDPPCTMKLAYAQSQPA
jgi:hypothetical protein